MTASPAARRHASARLVAVAAARRLPSRISTTSEDANQLAGSDSDYFNQMLANQTLGALWIAHSDDEERNRQFLAASAALIGAKPENELEGMLISQMIACHAASLECHRRAMLSEQTVR
jgi:hypothetical protein